MAIPTVTRVCQTCSVEFQFPACRVRRVNTGKYCSNACLAKSRKTGKLSRRPEARRAERERAKVRNPNLQAEVNRKARENYRKNNPPKPANPATSIFYKGPLISRQEAIKTGKKRYFTGRACKYGHVDEWLVGGGCVHCRRIHSSRKEEWESLASLKGDIRPRSSVCEICHRKCATTLLDHCHETQVFRGWLCDKCNLSLGLVNDDPKVLRRMARYLERHGKVDGKSTEEPTKQFFCWTGAQLPNS